MISRLLREKLITNFLIDEVLVAVAANNHFDLAKAVCMDFAEKWEVSSFFKRCLNIHRPLISHSTTFLYRVTKQLYNSAISKCVWLTMFWSWSSALHLALSVHILKTVNLFHLSSPHGLRCEFFSYPSKFPDLLYVLMIRPKAEGTYCTFVARTDFWASW